MPMPAERFARSLAEAARTRCALRETSPDDIPGSIDEAYQAQCAFLSQVQAVPVGWKIGATHAAAREHYGFVEPFFGRVVRDALYSSPTLLSRRTFERPGIEVEFGFRIGQEIRARATPHDRESVAQAISVVVPVVEIVDSRIAAWPDLPALALIADNGAHGALVVGRDKEDWRTIDLACTHVELSLNGRLRGSGAGSHVLGDPLNAVVWLANFLLGRGACLRPGEIVSSGSAAGVVWVEAGDDVSADFGPLGTVSVAFT